MTNGEAFSAAAQVREQNMVSTRSLKGIAQFLEYSRDSDDLCQDRRVSQYAPT